MKRMIVVMAALAAFMPMAHAASDPAKCRAMSQPMQQVAVMVRSAIAAMDEMDYASLSASFSGEEAAAWARVAEAQGAAMEPMRAYATALEDLAYRLVMCAR